MYIKVYQINSDRDKHRILFESYRRALKYSHKDYIDSAIYDQVFEGEIQNYQGLESLYKRFNLQLPDNYYGHSLSMSDVIEVIDHHNEVCHFYCDTFGFQQIEFDPSKAKIITKMADIFAKNEN